MIRDRLKKRARQFAIKAFGMEFDTEARDPNAGGRANPNDFDPTVIPKIVDGAGDTPGPNHKQDIGRTWVAAQLAGGVAPVFIDIRSPMEVATGVLPGAHRFPGQTIQQNLAVLPPKTHRVTVYDQTGDQGSADLAEALREQGWTLARRLRGGYAEWIEHGERTEQPTMSHPTSIAVGDTHRVGDQTGHVHDITADGTLLIWLESGELHAIAPD